MNETDTENNTSLPTWFWPVLVVVTLLVFAFGYWKSGSVLWGVAAVLAEFLIGALLTASEVFRRWLDNS